MKTFFLITILTLKYYAIGQVTFFIEQPSANTGNYEITYANQGSTSDWGVQDLSEAVNAVSGELTIAQSPDSLGCSSLINAIDVSGKIAVIWRGACEFGTKALNAQNAGAIGVVIVNHSGYPVGMGAASDGGNVTIPVVMVSTATGNLIYEELLTETINVFIGNKSGLYANDLGLGAKDVLRAKQFATPSAIAQDPSDFSVQPGAWVFNYGYEHATNVVLTCEITGTGVTGTYIENTLPVYIASGDSAWFTFPVFSQTYYPKAYYYMAYTVSSDSIDHFEFDNVVDANFAVTDYIFTYGRVEDNNINEPIGNSSYFSSASFLTACTHFKNANASNLVAYSLTFSASTNYINNGVYLYDSITGEGKELEVNVYKWNDSVKDINNPAFEIGDIEIATAQDTYEYKYTEDLQSQNVIQGIDPFLLEDDQSYLFCVTTYDNSVEIGFDTKTDYNQTILDGDSPSINEGEPATVFQTEDENGAVQWYGLGSGTNSQAAIGINFKDLLKTDETIHNFETIAFPNPASENVSIMLNDMSGSGFLTVVDLEGKVVISNNVTIDASKLTVDVSDLASGMYVFNLNLENGKTSTFNVVVNK
ncbi:MAG: PA domain-containing protein [Crocinitomicaceae bacterium]